MPTKLTHQKVKGFTLLELLLVLAIAGSILVMLLQFTTQKADEALRDRLTLQLQQVLNAALAYYIDYGKWPSNQTTLTSSELVTARYLSNATPVTSNPWGLPIHTASRPSAGNAPLFYVATVPGRNMTQEMVNANIIAGRLPMGYTTNVTNWNNYVAGVTQTVIPFTCTTSVDCMVVASVTIPGQNLNNARSINFGSIYRSGACVPVPTCPTGMTPNILVVPAGVYGVTENPAPCPNIDLSRSSPNACQRPAYPLVGYSAFATGGTGSGIRPPNCTGGPVMDCLQDVQDTWGTPSSVMPTGKDYYRVCLTVETERGKVDPNTYAWGAAMGSVIALTRCVPTNEPQGSSFNVWSK